MRGERLRQKLRGWWRLADQVARAEASEKLEWEAREMENIFALNVL